MGKQVRTQVSSHGCFGAAADTHHEQKLQTIERSTAWGSVGRSLNDETSST
jgi:hypothetical protein